MKKLNQLLDCSYNINVLGIVDDSRLVKNGYLFVATKGFNVDHFDYVIDAIKNGAVAIISDRFIDCSVPVIVVNNVNSVFVKLCQKFYDINSNDFRLIGITGTDGKTTTASVVYQLLSEYNAAYIGTNGVDVGNIHFNTNNTTPCISELYEIMSKLKKYGCKMIVMEVSSEALLHERIYGLNFEIIAFTNITEDHLNIHGTIEKYKEAKFSLVNYLKKNGLIILNGDDENCKMLIHDNICSFGYGSDNDYVIFDVKFSKNFVKFKIINNLTNEIYNIVSPLLGEYNIYNVVMAFLICLKLDISSDILIKKINDLHAVAGRREYLDFGQNFDIILDYAHTYNGIYNIINSVNSYKRIITVTGAAGGREKSKRAKIGKLVLEKSDFVIFTMDDPRFESVDSIIDDMISTTDLTNYERINDRTEAIYKAFDIARKGDVVLVLGKGRDNYMAIYDKKIPYCDYDVIKKYFQ